MFRVKSYSVSAPIYHGQSFGNTLWKIIKTKRSWLLMMDETDTDQSNVVNYVALTSRFLYKTPISLKHPHKQNHPDEKAPFPFASLQTAINVGYSRLSKCMYYLFNCCSVNGVWVNTYSSPIVSSCRCQISIVRCNRFRYVKYTHGRLLVKFID